jgi:hypothetical protein
MKPELQKKWIESNIKDPQAKKAMLKQLANNDRGLIFFLNAKLN